MFQAACAFHKFLTPVLISLCFSKTQGSPTFSALCWQEVKHIGSSHNRSALPFGSKVVTNQYNNPAGLYSSENIKDFNSAVDEVKTIATANEANAK